MSLYYLHSWFHNIKIIKQNDNFGFIDTYLYLRIVFEKDTICKTWTKKRTLITI